jgi:hypothetical protein
MKITRQLRLDALAADGTAPIQFTISWEGNRLRIDTGVVVKAQKDTPHASINPRLNRATQAAPQYPQLPELRWGGFSRQK